MKIKEVTVNYGVTRGTAVKFEFVRLDYAVTASVDEGEQASEVASQLRRRLRALVENGVTEEINFQQGDRMGNQIPSRPIPPLPSDGPPSISRGAKHLKRR
jgi:hypothetical protein